MTESNNTNADDTVVADRLDGAAGIGAFTGDPPWKIYQDAAQGRCGIYKIGRRIYGSKKLLRQDHLDRANANPDTSTDSRPTVTESTVTKPAGFKLASPESSPRSATRSVARHPSRKRQLAKIENSDS